MQDLTKILQQFENIVSPNCCDQLAKEHGFIQRSTSRVKGHEFAQSLMVPNAFLEAETLNSLAVRMHNLNHACTLSASALAQRINTKPAEAFMRACYEKVLAEIIRKDFVSLGDLPNLSCFNRVLIEDSTQAQLHEKLSPYFKGSGGGASQSSIKLDYVFDYLSEKIIDLKFCSGSVSDQALSHRLVPMLAKNDLVIRDLGYYALARIQEIEQKEAYFISRLKSDVVVYRNKDDTEPLDLAKFLDKYIWQGVVDIEIFIGKEKHPTRLIACLMSEEAINKRHRAENRKAQRRGFQISKKKLNLLKYCLFITNVPGSMLSGTSIMATYRARWRIELIFKEWKSCLKLHAFKGYNKQRFHCLLYGRLIMILLLGSIFPPLMQYALQQGRELSCYKLINYLVADHGFARALQEGRLDKFVGQLLKDLPRRLCMDKRKRQSLRSNVREGQSYYSDLKTTELQVNAA